MTAIWAVALMEENERRVKFQENLNNLPVGKGMKSLTKRTFNLLKI